MDRGAESYRRFLSGDDSGIEEIVREYKDGLILFLHTVVKDLYEAEELAEETFFRLLVKKPSFSGRSSFRSFLYAIGRHIALDRIRKDRRTAPMPEDPEAIRDETDLARSVTRSEAREEVRRALSDLPADYRQVLWLSYFEELTNGECARVMNKSGRQIRNLLYRAKGALRAKLEKEGVSGEEF